MTTPDGYVKLKTVKYKRQFHTIYRSINEAKGELKQMLEDEELEVLQPCERDGSPAPEGILKSKPIHFFITRKRCHFKLPSNLPFFGDIEEDEEEEEEDEEIPSPPDSPASPSQLSLSESAGTPPPAHPPAAPASSPFVPPPHPSSPSPAQPAAPSATAHLPQIPAFPPSPSPAVPPSPTQGLPSLLPHTPAPSSTTTTTTTTTTPTTPVRSSQRSDKRSLAQNRELMLFVKINNNYYEIKGGFTTKCLGAKKEPEKEDNLIIGRWLWLTCVSNNNKTGVNFTMKCLLIIAGPNDQNLYMTSPQFVTLSTASSRKVTYLSQLTMKSDAGQQADMGDDEEDDEGDEEGEGMQIAYAQTGGDMEMEIKREPPKGVTAGGGAVAVAPQQLPPGAPIVLGSESADVAMIDAVGGAAGGGAESEGITFVVNALPRGDEASAVSGAARSGGAAAPRPGKYALRKGMRVLYRTLSESSGGGGSPHGGESAGLSASGHSTPGGAPSSEKKKGKKVKNFDEWLEELRLFKSVHGHCQPKRKHFGKRENEQKKLAYWVERQRSNWKTGTLSEARKKKLDELGFIWPKKGKKRRSPNDKDDEPSSPSPTRDSSSNASNSMPSLSLLLSTATNRPIGKTRLEEGRKRLEGEKALFDALKKDVDDDKKKLDDEWARLRDERAKLDKDKNDMAEQLKQEYDRKTWEMLEKWKEEWRGLEQGRREIEEQGKRLMNEQMRSENVKRKLEGGSSASGNRATQVVKRRRIGEEGGEGGGGGADVDVAGDDVSVADIDIIMAGGEEGLGGDTGGEKGGVVAELPEPPQTRIPAEEVSGGGLQSAILERLDALLAGQKRIIDMLAGAGGGGGSVVAQSE